ncbi:MAG: DUF3352 domain-containing protein [Actinobacteria bacterium]|nr:MAG: DUF3352 domain-containing protein [Actinomycetota bacterium]
MGWRHLRSDVRCCRPNPRVPRVEPIPRRDRTATEGQRTVSDQPPNDDTAGPPVDAKPGDTWSLDPRSRSGDSFAGPPEGALSVTVAEVTEGGGVAPPPAPRRGLKVAGVALAAVLVLAGVAGAAAFMLLRGSSEAILGKVPSSADVVVTANLDPAASQKMNLLHIASRFPALGGQDQIRQQLNQTLDGLLRDVGMSHEDVQWVGSEVGLYVDVKSTQETSYAILIATDDQSAAAASLQKFRAGLESQGATFHSSDHDGAQITVSATTDHPSFAIVDGVVVLGSDEGAVAAVIDTAHGGPSIADDATFQRVTGALPQSRLGVAFVDTAQLLGTFGDVLGAAGVTTGVTSLDALDGVGVSLSAESNGLALDTVMMYDDAKLSDVQRQTLSAADHPNELIELVPDDALGMYAVEHLDAAIADQVGRIAASDPQADQELKRLSVTGPGGLLSQLTGDVAAAASPEQGTIPVGGVLMVGTNDPAATSKWLDDTLQTLPLGATAASCSSNGGCRITHETTRWATESHGGVTVTYASSGAALPVAYAVIGDVAVVGSSRAQVEHVIDVHAGGPAISAAARFTSATASVPTDDGVLYLDVPAIVNVVRGQFPPAEVATFDNEIGRSLKPIEAVVAGTKNEPDLQRTRVFIWIP